MLCMCNSVLSLFATGTSMYVYITHSLLIMSGGTQPCFIALGKAGVCDNELPDELISSDVTEPV